MGAVEEEGAGEGPLKTTCQAASTTNTSQKLICLSNGSGGVIPAVWEDCADSRARTTAAGGERAGLPSAGAAEEGAAEFVGAGP